MKQRDFDVIVVGGGHAGTEAAMAAHRRGARTALITHRFDRLGEMSCNPAVGGLGKGHIVREIDALDGVMGWAADAAGIQFRLLNRSKGPAAQGPRAQTDRALYRNAIQNAFRSRSDLTVREAEVVDLRLTEGRVNGVVLAEGSEISASAVILTTGTFLNGLIHVGRETFPAGRSGDPASTKLAARVSDLGLDVGRLKTGTPPRLDSRTIDWHAVEEQPGDKEPVFLSFLTRHTSAPQVSCGLTETNSQAHEIIRRNLGESALFSGRIHGTGPRYCPSIEDKVVRFAEKPSHQVFLEPEGAADPTVYPNGLSTSLPADVQLDILRSMRGLGAVRIVRPGYAIEYDYLDPRGLDRRLAVRSCAGLFLAGQINGTTGYEEAAGQGLMAGLNAAAHALCRDAIELGRESSYIGVMIDDLVSRGVTEPYRMFTSRAEFRLHLRADNADQRLTPLGIRLGCVGEPRSRAFGESDARRRLAMQRTQDLVLTPPEATTRGFTIKQDGVRRSLFELIGQPDMSVADVVRLAPEVADLDSTALEQVMREARYAPYVARQEQDVARLKRDEALILPREISYGDMAGLSSELQAKLERARPETLAQASRIEGMTPAALTLVLLHARKLVRAAE